MGNKLTGGMKITLDRERTAVFDMNTLCRIEEVISGNALELLEDLGRGFAAYQKAQKQKDAGEDVKMPPLPVTMRLLRAMLWAALVEDDPKLTLEQLGALVNMQNFQRLAMSLQKLMSQSMPGSESPAENPRDAPAESGSLLSVNSGLLDGTI
jgi:hypothetical protein